MARVVLVGGVVALSVVAYVRSKALGIRKKLPEQPPPADPPNDNNKQEVDDHAGAASTSLSALPADSQASIERVASAASISSEGARRVNEDLRVIQEALLSKNADALTSDIHFEDDDIGAEGAARVLEDLTVVEKVLLDETLAIGELALPQSAPAQSADSRSTSGLLTNEELAEADRLHVTTSGGQTAETDQDVDMTSRSDVVRPAQEQQDTGSNSSTEHVEGTEASNAKDTKDPAAACGVKQLSETAESAAASSSEAVEQSEKSQHVEQQTVESESASGSVADSTAVVKSILPKSREEQEKEQQDKSSHGEESAAAATSASEDQEQSAHSQHVEKASVETESSTSPVAVTAASVNSIQPKPTEDNEQEQQARSGLQVGTSILGAVETGKASVAEVSSVQADLARVVGSDYVTAVDKTTVPVQTPLDSQSQVVDTAAQKDMENMAAIPAVGSSSSLPQAEAAQGSGTADTIGSVVDNNTTGTVTSNTVEGQLQDLGTARQKGVETTAAPTAGVNSPQQEDIGQRTSTVGSADASSRDVQGSSAMETDMSARKGAQDMHVVSSGVPSNVLSSQDAGAKDDAATAITQALQSSEVTSAEAQQSIDTGASEGADSKDDVEMHVKEPAQLAKEEVAQRAGIAGSADAFSREAQGSSASQTSDAQDVPILPPQLPSEASSSQDAGSKHDIAMAITQALQPNEAAAEAQQLGDMSASYEADSKDDMQMQVKEPAQSASASVAEAQSAVDRSSDIDGVSTRVDSAQAGLSVSSVDVDRALPTEGAALLDDTQVATAPAESSNSSEGQPASLEADAAQSGTDKDGGARPDVAVSSLDSQQQVTSSLSSESKTKDNSNGYSADQHPVEDTKRPSAASSKWYPTKDLVLTVVAGCNVAPFTFSNTAQASTIKEPPSCYSVVVGRGTKVDFTLPDIEVSSRHARIDWDSQAGSWQVQDLGSLNGTFLNDRVISSTVERKSGTLFPLKHGDTLTFGTLTKVEVGLVDSSPTGATLAPSTRLEFAVREHPNTNRSGEPLPMEDVVDIHWPLQVDRGSNAQTIEFGLVCVFDGHLGRAGADQAKDALHKSVAGLLAAPGAIDAVIKERSAQALLQQAFAATEKSMTLEHEGCTATALLIWQTPEQTYCQVANVGDSACVLGRDKSAIKFSADHKLSDPKERQRLADLGVALKDGENRRFGLNLGRALGDKFLKSEDVFLSAEPFVSEAIEMPSSSFAIVATDGLWDVTSAQQAVDIAANAAASTASDQSAAVAERMAGALLDHAQKNRTVDNTTLVVVRFL